MKQALSLLELNLLVKDTLENQLDPVYWVIAEIAELNQGRQGHAYLDLVEKQGQQIAAKMRANIWAYTFRGIASKFQSITCQPLKSGMRVLAQVSITFHEVYGLSLNIRDIDPDFTLGERARVRQEIIEKLSKEGLLVKNKALKLSKVPQKVAVISSATAAGYGDFVKQLQNNRYGYQVQHHLFQATLQGNEAVNSLIAALQAVYSQHMTKSFDALVLIRGGGAQLDLDCFDDEDLARELAKSPIPVITGIGHERDETIADLVAHTKMKTPTATAEFLISGFLEFEEQLEWHWKQIQRYAEQVLFSEERKLRDLEHRMRQQATFNLQKGREMLHYTLKQIRTLAAQPLQLSRIRLNNLNLNLEKSSLLRIQRGKEHLDTMEKDLQRLNPQRFLEMGYTRTEIKGIPIHQAQVKEGDEIETFGLKQKIRSKVIKLENYGK
ncbi:exodeoxyribonuclease VII large subunit [Cecembia lonarensis]|uniref:Exodeoxyribonuclease 7 large subunit n=1 Tax=Cecembia lonarensis (strain CCUG 58316 / KCTC 22772 / LW9) TaxID=1225176 RepID=K1L2L1_CECL9|nr:exodeoxyribonuclease VII large subunit [Cecembia lonarensis]EKB50640.1 Exodeoxyribonuclease 7 large subunit [Cecembia lonarensis LW9]